MSLRSGFILAVGLIALGAASAQAQDDRLRKTDNGRYGDDDRLYKTDGAYDDDYYDEYDDDDMYVDRNSRGGARAMGGRMRGMDTNRDGRITRSEWRGNAEAFSRRDRNGDGILAGREVRANNRNRNRNRDGNDTGVDTLGAYDRNRDGVVSRGEWTGRRDDFDRLDRNRDGYLTSSEASRRN